MALGQKSTPAFASPLPSSGTLAPLISMVRVFWKASCLRRTERSGEGRRRLLKLKRLNLQKFYGQRGKMVCCRHFLGGWSQWITCYLQVELLLFIIYSETYFSEGLGKFELYYVVSVRLFANGSLQANLPNLCWYKKVFITPANTAFLVLRFQWVFRKPKENISALSFELWESPLDLPAMQGS